MFKNHLGFTLIELLIVVAIIAILAAIAIPNFLAAQVRAKVARVKGEMRTLTTAIESYYVDNNTYLQDWMANPGAYQIKSHEELSTPIAYVTSVSFQDPFAGQAKDDVGLPINYRLYNYKKLGGTPVLNQCCWNWADAMGSAEFDHNGYVLLSQGPDAGTGGVETVDGAEWYDRMPLSVNPQADFEMGRIYDPTNGTISNGDIIRLGGETLNPQP